MHATAQLVENTAYFLIASGVIVSLYWVCNRKHWREKEAIERIFRSELRSFDALLNGQETTDNAMVKEFISTMKDRIASKREQLETDHKRHIIDIDGKIRKRTVRTALLLYGLAFLFMDFSPLPAQ